jgi:basic membrane protein A
VKLAKQMIILACVGALGLTACGSGTAKSGNGGGANTPKKIKVAVLMPGTANDGSWGEVVSTGAKAAGKLVAAEVTIAENLNDTGQYQQQGNAFAAQGFDLVVNANASMVSVTTDLAKKYPKVDFAQIGHIDSPAKNVRAVTPKFWQGTFAAGYLAALMSKTGTVGTIGGFEFPLLTSQMEGFALGARYANASIKIKRQYINTWTDAGVAGSASEALAAEGVDTIFSATDQATQGIFKTMQGRPDHYVIAQYRDKHDQAPDVVLTSVLYGLDNITSSFITDVANDKWVSANVDVTIADGIKLAPFADLTSKIPADVQTKLKQVEDDIASGAIVLPDLDALGKTGAADTVDLKSLKK